MKRNVSVVRFKFRCNILISGKIIKEMPGSVASGTPYISFPCLYTNSRLCSLLLQAVLYIYQPFGFKGFTKSRICSISKLERHKISEMSKV